MAPYTGDIRIQGLHVVNVLSAAKALVAKLASYGGAEKLVGNGIPNPELSELEAAVNRLVQFEREAKSRGTLKHTTDAEDLAHALDAARGLLGATPSQRDALHMTEQESNAEFSSDDLFSTTEEAPAPAEAPEEQPATKPDDDPFAVPQ